MASFSNDKNIVEKEFNFLKGIFNELKKELTDFDILSMGMSNDYEIALEAGSNMIRIGSKYLVAETITRSLLIFNTVGYFSILLNNIST